MDISARAISLADRPQRAIRVTSVRMRREDRSSISSHPLADLGWKLLIGLRHRLLLISRSSFVRAGSQNGDRVARRGGQGRPSRLGLRLAPALPGGALTAPSTARGSR